MKRPFFLVLFSLMVAGSSIAQDKYFSRNGKISFYSKAPVEDIEAHHNQVSSILNMETGELVFSMLMNGFQFEKALMQEHFNENYIESEKFPKATFQGKITNWSEFDLTKKGEYEAQVTGDITIHGVTKAYETTAKMVQKGDEIQANCNFKVVVADHEIKIPSAVIDNIAKVVDVTVDISYKPYQK